MAFLSENEITEEKLDYIVNEIESLSEFSELDIENYGDREVLNPDVEDIEDPEGISDQEAAKEELVLGFAESVKAKKPRKRKFRKIKRKVRRIVCDILGGLNDDVGVDIKEILKSVLVALIPAFAGVPAFVSIIIVALLALFLKKGYNRVCPA